jgi:hypothetical protein
MPRNYRFPLYIVLIGLVILNPIISGHQGNRGVLAVSAASLVDRRIQIPGTMKPHAAVSYAESNPAIKIEITGPERAWVGEEITYLITLSNDRGRGDGSAISNITVLDDLGRAFVFVGGDVNNNNLLEFDEIWQYERPMKIHADDPHLIELKVYASGYDQDGNTVSEQAGIQLNVGYNPNISLNVSGRKVATIGETVTFQITATNQIISIEVERYDFSVITKFNFKTPERISRITKDYHIVQDGKTSARLQKDEIIWMVVFTTLAAFASMIFASIWNTIRPQPGRKVMVLCVIVGILTGIGYSGFTRFDWGERFISKSQLIPTPPSLPASTPVVTNMKTVDIGDGSPVGDISVSSPGAIKINFIQGDSNQDRMINLGENWLFEFSHTIKSTDPDVLIYPVVFSGLDGDGDLINIETSITLEVEYSPVINILKTGPESANLDEPVTYGFTIRNDSTMGDGSPISQVSVSDNISGQAIYVSGDKDEDELLEVGESWIYTVTHVFLAKDHVPVDRTVTVTGQDPDGTFLSYTQNYILNVGFSPTLQMTATGLDSGKVGDRLTFTIEVTHDPDTSDGSLVRDLKVTDTTEQAAVYRSGDSNADHHLGVGERWIFEFPYTISKNDLDPIQLTFNSSGQDQDGGSIQAETTLLVEIEYNPSITLQVTGPDTAEVGDQINCQITAINDTVRGDGSPINDLTVMGLDGISIPYTSGDSNQNYQLDPQEKWFYELTYDVQPTVISPLTLPFVITGLDQDGEPLTAEASYPLEVKYTPVITAQTKAPEIADFNDQVSVEILVSNDPAFGDGSPIRNVVVTDSAQEMIVFSGGDNDSDSILDAGESWIYNVTITVSPDDPGKLERVIYAAGEDGNGNPVSTADTYSIEVDYHPSIKIQAAGPVSAQVGDVVTVSYTLTHDVDRSDGSSVRDIETSVYLGDSATFIGGDRDKDGLLEAGENWVYTSMFTIDESESETIEKTLDVNAIDLDGEPVSASHTFNLYKLHPFANGDFELQDAGWDFKNNGLKVSTIRTSPTEDHDIPINTYAALLGATDYECSPDGIPLGYAEISRSFSVPEAPTGKHVRLRFNYVIYSQDTSTKPDYDRFEVFINDIATPIFSDGNQVNESLGCNVWWRVPGPRNIRDGKTSGWATGFIDLDRYQGETIKISFQNHNRFDSWYNTFTYLDNIAIEFTN